MGHHRLEGVRRDAEQVGGPAGPRIPVHRGKRHGAVPGEFGGRARTTRITALATVRAGMRRFGSHAHCPWASFARQVTAVPGICRRPVEMACLGLAEEAILSGVSIESGRDFSSRRRPWGAGSPFVVPSRRLGAVFGPCSPHACSSDGRQTAVEPLACGATKKKKKKKKCSVFEPPLKKKKKKKKK